MDEEECDYVNNRKCSPVSREQCQDVSEKVPKQVSKQVFYFFASCCVGCSKLLLKGGNNIMYTFAM